MSKVNVGFVGCGGIANFHFGHFEKISDAQIVAVSDLVEEGDYVRAGAPLLEIKPSPTPLELADAQRQVSLADLQVENAKRDLDRQKTLAAQKLTSEQALQDAQQKYQEAVVSQQAAHEQYTLMKDGRLSGSDTSVATVVRRFLGSNLSDVDVRIDVESPSHRARKTGSSFR